MVIQVSKDFLNDRRVFNAGNDLEETGAFVANTGLLEWQLSTRSGLYSICAIAEIRYSGDGQRLA